MLANNIILEYIVSTLIIVIIGMSQFDVLVLFQTNFVLLFQLFVLGHNFGKSHKYFVYESM